MCLAQFAVSKKGSCCDILPLELGAPLMQVLPTECAALTNSLSRPGVIHKVIFVKVSTVHLISFRPFGGSAARNTGAWSDAAKARIRRSGGGVDEGLWEDSVDDKLISFG